MRITHLTPTYFGSASVIGGGERYVHNVAAAVARASGHEQRIVTMGPEDAEFTVDGIPVLVLRNGSSLAGPMSACSPALRQHIAAADLVHVHQALTVFGAYCAVLARSVGVPAVGTDLGGGDNALLVERGGLELFDGLVSISQFAHDLVAPAFTGPHEVLIGPVDTARFAPDPDARRDPTAILIVGRILPHKGIDRVIEALPDGVSLTVVGAPYDPDYADTLRDLARGKDVTFRHDVTDDGLVDLYRRCGLFVQASTSVDRYGRFVRKPELMGLTTLEAMACGAPVLVAASGSLPELVGDPAFSRVFADDAELRDLLLEVRARRWPPAGAGQLAADHVRTHHSMPVVGGLLSAFYDQVLARAAVPAS